MNATDVRGPRKQCVALLAMLVSCAGLAAAQTNTVADPVGFVRVEVPPSCEKLVAMPFYAFDPDIQAVFAGQLSGATNESAADALRQWDPLLQGYTNAYKADLTGDPARDGWWFDDFASWNTSSLAFYPGQGFWIKNSQAVTQNVYLCGNVVLDAAFTNNVEPGLTLLGYPFSSSIRLNATAMTNQGAYAAGAATNADRLSAWDPILSEYVQYALKSDDNQWHSMTNWSGAPSDDLLELGRGYFYHRMPTNGYEWAESRPYSSGFALNTNPPVVDAMSVNASGDALTLHVKTTGSAGETLEVYYKDMVATGALNDALWNLAATGIVVGGASSAEWTDSGAGDRGKIHTVYARCYLVGRGDVDADGDGLPDARETFVLGTNPGHADTDGDGVADGLELAYGRDPLVAEPPALPFVENFETDTCAAGDLDGQNGWECSVSNAALVQTQVVWEGDQALNLMETNGPLCEVRHSFSMPVAAVVWADFHSKAVRAFTPTGAISGSAAFHFDAAGRLVVYDGTQAQGSRWVTLTHSPVSTGSWVRLTVKTDYSAQRWSLFLHSACVAQNLGFASSQPRLAAFGLDARQAALDNVTLSLTAPEGIDEDQDGLPDDWEIQYFGDLDETGDGDPDGDGLSNLQEYQIGTNPANMDTDQDGLSDALEIYFGKNPAVSNAWMQLPFAENFETDTCAAGDLDGQNGWECSVSNAALVQTQVVWEGDQALVLSSPTGSVPVARHLFAQGTNGIVWADLHTLVRAAAAPTGAEDSAAAFYFDVNGTLRVYDGLLGRWLATPSSATPGTWTRLTVRMDYGAGRWDLFRDGLLAASGVGMQKSMTGFAGLSVAGRKAELDQLTIGATMPSSDDTDGDGLADLAEQVQYGTDPLLADSDGDGASDGYEVNTLATDPLVADQGSDPDGPTLEVTSPTEGELILW